MAGTLTANGSGGITGGAVDLTGPSLSSTGTTIAFQANSAIGSGSKYNVGVDGRGTATLSTSSAFGTITLAFVLQDSSHGLVIEFDQNATGSGTLDLQTAGTTPSGSYAFSLFGANATGDLASVGNFTVGSSGSISGLQDFTNNTLAYTNLALSGQVVLGPSASPSTQLSTNSGFATLTFDAIPIDATHLKFIEQDAFGTLLGDAYSQTSSSMPVGTLPFTLGGAVSSSLVPTAAGGFMVTDSSGDITNASSQDINEGGTASTASVTFSGNYAASGTGRYLLSLSGFQGATQFVAYPSSAGLFMLQIDSQGILSGIAYPAQTSTTFASSQGYGFNLSGSNVGADSTLGYIPEVDNIAEFTAASAGGLTGYLDENCMPGCPDAPISNISLGGSTFVAASGGRGQISTPANSSINTLNGGFVLTYYTVDGTTVPFIEVDQGQVATGVMVQQNAGSSAAAMAKASGKHLYVPLRMLRARKAQPKQK